jgi:hypothetical protein
MDKVPAIVRGTLERLEEQGVLGPEESIVEQELAALSGKPGSLFVTGQRVLFVRASALSDKLESVSLPLAEIATADASERRSPIRKRGVLRLNADAEAETVFEHIPGGAARAEELAGAIIGQRDARTES